MGKIRYQRSSTHFKYKLCNDLFSRRASARPENPCLRFQLKSKKYAIKLKKIKNTHFHKQENKSKGLQSSQSSCCLVQVYAKLNFSSASQQ